MCQECLGSGTTDPPKGGLILPNENNPLLSFSKEWLETTSILVGNATSLELSVILKRKFSRKLGRIVRRVNNGGDIDRAVNSFRKLSRESSESAYKLGINTIEKSGKVTLQDGPFLDLFSHRQALFFNRWARQIRGNIPPSPVSDKSRREMYATTLDSAFTRGALSRLPSRSVVTWVLTAKESCPNCIDFAGGGPYEPSTLPAVPRDGETRCKMSCKCYLQVSRAPASI